MFITQGDKKGNDFWKYLVGSLIVFIASIVGQIPIGIAVFYGVFVNHKPIPINDKDLYTMFDSNLFLFLMLISFVFAIFGLYLVVKKFHNQAFKEIITSSRPTRFKI